MLTEMVVNNYIPNDTHMDEEARVQVWFCLGTIEFFVSAVLHSYICFAAPVMHTLPPKKRLQSCQRKCPLNWCTRTKPALK